MKNICVSREGFEVGAMNKQNYKEVSTIGRWGRMHRNQQKYNNKQKQKNMPGLPEYMFEEGESL